MGGLVYPMSRHPAPATEAIRKRLWSKRKGFPFDKRPWPLLTEPHLGFLEKVYAGSGMPEWINRELEM